MISFKELVDSAKTFNKSESEDYQVYKSRIDELRKLYCNSYRRPAYKPTTKYNFQKNGKNTHNRNNNRQRTTTHKDSKLKSLLANSDKMINSFTGAINKLNESNFKIIYAEVVDLFTKYIGGFITDYVESYVKFGVNGKCEVEDLNLETINEKYIHYQYELWKILMDKYINKNGSYMMYYKFITNLISWKTDVFNDTLIKNIKSVFKSYCGYDYDIIRLDGVDDEDPEQFFKRTIVELDDRNTAIYNKITDIINIFTEYDFSLSKITESNNKFLETINEYINNPKSLTELNITETENSNIVYKKLLQRYLRRTELAEKLGILEYYYLRDSNSITSLTSVLDQVITYEDKSNEICVISYMLMGMLNAEDIRTKLLDCISKENIKEKMEKLSSKLPALIKYKLMDILDVL